MGHYCIIAECSPDGRSDVCFGYKKNALTHGVHVKTSRSGEVEVRADIEFYRIKPERLGSLLSVLSIDADRALNYALEAAFRAGIAYAESMKAKVA